MQVNTHQAKSQLSRLIDQALAGEEIIISRNNQPLVRLTPLSTTNQARSLGSCPDLIRSMGDDFDAPLDDFSEYME